jgi:hypothetical protein
MYMDDNHSRQLKIKLMRRLRTMYLILLLLILAACIFLSYLWLTGYVPQYRGEKPLFPIADVLLPVIAIPFILFGYFWPSIAIEFKMSQELEIEMLYNYLLRASTFISIPILTVVLEYAGAVIFAWLPILIATAIISIVTFPSKKRWAKWMDIYQQKVKPGANNK